MANTRKVSDAVQAGMIAAYLAGNTTREAAARFGYSGGACYNALRRHGVLPRSFSSARRRHAVNESFFDAIDSEEKAYWLGFLSADGGIVRNSIVLILSERDGEHLIKFRQAIASQHPLNHFHRYGHDCAKIVIFSQRLVQSLARLGVGERKSFRLKPCSLLATPLLRHYWRGMIDGDGWISPNRRGKWSVGLCGTRMICEAFRRFVARRLRSNATVRPCRSIFVVSFNGTLLPRRVAAVLYTQARVFLDRKMRLVESLLGTDISVGEPDYE